MMQKSYTRGVCLCFSSQCLVVTTGCCSVLLSLAALLPCVFLLVSSSAWDLAMKTARQWLDKGEVTITVGEALDWVEENYHSVMGGIILAIILHLLFSLLLILGSMLYKRNLFLPWLVTNIILIIFMVFIFTFWTFLSFFAGFITTVTFPFVCGLVLGAWIFLWRQVRSAFVLLGQTEQQILAMRRHQGGYQPVPGQGGYQGVPEKKAPNIAERNQKQ